MQRVTEVVDEYNLGLISRDSGSSGPAECTVAPSGGISVANSMNHGVSFDNLVTLPPHPLI